jgi:uncharacterized protein (TIGR02246 family)
LAARRQPLVTWESYPRGDRPVNFRFQSQASFRLIGLWSYGRARDVGRKLAIEMKYSALLASVFVVLSCACFAQTPSEKPATSETPEKAALVARERDFEAAYAKSNVTEISAFFTEDAEYTTEDGRVFSGRAAIERAIRDSLAANQGAKLAIAVDSVRLLTPEVAVEKGTTTVTAKDGGTDTSLYTAVQVKKDDQWRISQLTESGVASATPRERLAELEWMIGSWAEKEGDVSISSTFDWARGGNFLARNVTVKRGDETTLEGWQIVGWDSAQGRIRSWTFDTEGGFADAVWTRDGDRWLVRESGTVPDGSRTTADNTITKLSSDRFSWESNNRTLDGEPQPGIGRVEINRVKGD